MEARLTRVFTYKLFIYFFKKKKNQKKKLTAFLLCLACRRFGQRIHINSLDWNNMHAYVRRVSTITQRGSADGLRAEHREGNGKHPNHKQARP